ncbi:multidrug ABC transporter ATP-binding protein [uncultured archaeon]|nr:multidrug ABC transporter ATP-binding protein [uncultured archaeon]
MAIEVNSIVKRFGDKEAVRGLSFSVSKGERVALLGPNGAGKSTTLKVIAGLLKPEEGEARLGGYLPNQLEAKRMLGYLPEDATPYMSLSVRENLEYIGAIRGTENLRDRVNYLFDLLDLGQYQRTKTNNLSRGNRQKLALALAMVHNPSVIVMDEPLNYLDIPTQERVIDSLMEMKASFLVSTHIMSIAERLTEKVIIISNGQTVWTGDIQDLRKFGDPKEPVEKIVARMMRSVS